MVGFRSFYGLIGKLKILQKLHNEIKITGTVAPSSNASIFFKGLSGNSLA